jgi:hypothetical protein
MPKEKCCLCLDVTYEFITHEGTVLKLNENKGLSLFHFETPVKLSIIFLCMLQLGIIDKEKLVAHN